MRGGGGRQPSAGGNNVRRAAAACALGLLLCHPAGTRSAGVPRAVFPGAVTGDAVGALLLGGDPFPWPPASTGGASVILPVQLSAGAGAEALAVLGPGRAPAALAFTGLPSPAGPLFTRFLPPAACGEHAVFWAGLEGGAPGAGLFLGSSGILSTLVLAGDPAPGGGTMAALGASPTVDATGRAVFLAVIEPGSVSSLYAGTAGGLERILAAGDPAPGGGVIDAILWAGSGCDGTVRVLAAIAEGLESAVSLLAGTGSGWSRLLTEGDPLPGGGSFAGMIGAPASVTASGVILTAALQPPGGQAVLHLAAEGSLQVLARSGETFPAWGAATAFGPPAHLEGSRAAVRIERLDGAAAIVALDAGGAPPEILLASGDTAPGGSPLSRLGDPAAAGAGALALLAEAAGMRGLLHRSGPADLSWLARAGEALPGLGRLLAGGLVHARPAVEPAGALLFTGRLAGTARGDGPALLRAAPGQPPEVLIAPGDAAPGGGAVVSLDGPPAVAGGDGAVAASLEGPAGRRTAYLLRNAAGGLTTAVAEGDATPVGGTFRTLGRSLAGDPAGRLVFAATIAGGSAASGIFVCRVDRTLATAAVAGGEVPGGGTLAAFGFSPAAAGDGDAAFLAATSGARTGTGIFLAQGSSPPGAPPAPLQALARTGDPAPGGGLLATLFDPVGTTAGDVAFLATLDDGRWAALAWDGSSLRQVLTAGDPLPVAGTAGEFQALAVDAAGRVSVSTGIQGGGHAQGVFREADAGLDLVLASGSPVPPAPGSPSLAGPPPLLARVASLAAAPDGSLTATADIVWWSAGAALITEAADTDADGWADVLDCDPLKAAAFSLPPAASGLRVDGAAGGAPRLSWDDLRPASGSGTVHDVLAGPLSGLRSGVPFDGSACAAPGVQGTEATLAPSPVGPGDGTWYLVRGRNACGTGGMGGPPARLPLAGLACPGGEP